MTLSLRSSTQKSKPLLHVTMIDTRSYRPDMKVKKRVASVLSIKGSFVGLDLSFSMKKPAAHPRNLFCFQR